MNLFSRASTLALLFLSTFAAQAKDMVVFCNDCSTLSQFESAARAESAAWYGEHTILAVNPNTKYSIRIYLNHIRGTSGGGTGVPASISGDSHLNSVPAGSIISLSNDTKQAATTKQPMATTSRTGDQWQSSFENISTEEEAEINTIIEVTKQDSIIALPQNAYFESFAQRNEPAVSNDIWAALTEKYGPTWAGKGLRDAFIKLLQNRAKKIFRPRQQSMCNI